MPTSENENNPSQAIHTIRLRLQELSTQLRDDRKQLNDPRVQALFATSAEVLDGLMKAFSQHEHQEGHAFPEQPGLYKYHGIGGEADSRLD